MTRTSKTGQRIWMAKCLDRLPRPRPNARVLLLFLQTGPVRTSIPGLLGVGSGTLAEYLGWSPEVTRARLKEIEALGLVRVDLTAPIIWLPGETFASPPPNRNVAVAWGRTLAELCECPFREKIRKEIGQFLQADFGGRGIAPAFEQGFATSPRYRSRHRRGVRRGLHLSFESEDGGAGPGHEQS